MPNPPYLTYPYNAAANLRVIAESLVELTRLDRGRREERGFVASALKEVSASGGTLNMHLKNPTGSGVVLDVVNALPSTQFQGTTTVYDAFDTAPSGGTQDGIDNLTLDSEGGEPTKGSAEVNQDVDYVGGEPHWQEAIPSGGVGGQGGIGGRGKVSAPVIEPGREIVVEVTNQSASAEYASIGFVYVERDPGVVTT